VTDDEEKWRRRLERERSARHTAEHLLEEKSLELYRANEELRALAAHLESEVDKRTAELRRALDERELLLKEVHHRVKNNLQIIASLLDMQADMHAATAVRDVLLDSTYRVRAMALIHQQLYAGDDLARIEFGAYAASLARTLVGALEPRADLTITTEAITIPIGTALPCGLILNEVIANALKHGRSADGRCRIDVSVHTQGDDMLVSVVDDGPGLSAPWGAVASRSLGKRIVNALARQLRAHIDTSVGPGLRFALRLRRDRDVDDAVESR
jgi:two-component sensor histidine kinase